MTLSQAFVLGVLQGVTEFFPVSSSGHLVLLELWWDFAIEPTHLQGFDVLLHTGTAAALLLCYRQTWTKLLLAPLTGDQVHRRLLGQLVIATIPAGIAGLLFRDVVVMHFRTLGAVASAFFLTGCVLLMAHGIRLRSTRVNAKWCDALWMGLAQACAIVPGLSRSGFTISAGQMSGLSRQAALDFSFLMALPIICAATLLLVLDLWTGAVALPAWPISLVGFSSSFLAGVAAILWLRRFVARQSLAWFALYLFPLACALLTVNMMHT